MSETLAPLRDETEIVPVQKLAGRVAGTFSALSDHFETRATPQLELTFAGIVGDYHAGVTRKSGPREPWFERGTEIRNARQITIVSPEELAVIAECMGIAEVRSEWIGANLLVEGVPRLSMLPPGTLLFFASGAALRVMAQNGPCRISGRVVARYAGMADTEEGGLAFAKVAKRYRGLVASVEKPGRITAGDEVTLRVPEQWIYRP